MILLYSFNNIRNKDCIVLLIAFALVARFNDCIARAKTGLTNLGLVCSHFFGRTCLVAATFAAARACALAKHVAKHLAWCVV